MTDFQTVRTDTDAVVLRPVGRLTMVTAPDLREALHALVAAGDSRIVVDLRDVEFIDSSGLGALISGLRAARQAGGDLRIAAPNQQVQSVMEVTSLNRVLNSYESPEAAFTDRT
jgi:anti-anti-sigma factor